MGEEIFYENSLLAPPVISPVSAYGEGKRVSELLGTITAKKHGFDFLITRLFAFIGPYLPVDTHYAAGNFIGNAVKGDNIIVKGDGTPIRSYMYSADLIIWLLKVLFHGTSCSPYNIGSEEGVSIKELARIVGDIAKVDVKIQGVYNNTPVEKYLPSTKKAMDELDLKLYTGLHESIEKTFRWNEMRMR